MEYVITTGRPFDETEALIVDALEQQGLVVQRTFSLRTAVVAGAGSAEDSAATRHSEARDHRPRYSVLMLYASGVQSRPHGLLALYEREDRMVINPMPTPEAGARTSFPGAADYAADADASLVAALLRSGLEFCLHLGEGERCIDSKEAADGFAQ
jgi:hypothetical protein